MSRLPRSVSSVTSVVAIASAVALGGWEAERMADRVGPGQQRAAPARPALAMRQSAVSFPSFDDRLALDPRLDEAGTPASPESASPAQAADHRDEPGQAAAERLSEAMRRLARDLEYNTDLPAPPQQVVVAAPPAWTPSPSAEGAAPPVIEEVAPGHAPAAGGTTVTIRGKNLRPSQVMFGPAPARIVSASAEAVTVVAPPAHAGQVAIALTNGDGTYDITRTPFSYGP